MSKILNYNFNIEINKYEIPINQIDEDIEKTDKNLKKHLKSKKNKIAPPTVVERTTTGRKIIDVLKDCDHSESNETSVDIKTEYGEENIEIRNSYNFKNHKSALDSILTNNKVSFTPIEIHDSIFLNKDPTSITPEKTPIYIEEKKSQSKNNDKLSSLEIEKSEISNRSISKIKINKISKDNITMKYDSDFSFNEDNISDYKQILFKEIMLFKNREYLNEYERNHIVDLTKIIYKDKECMLLLRNEYLYILEINKNINENEEQKDKSTYKKNPDLSLLLQIEEKETVKDESYKFIYNISHPLVCINFNLLSCKLLINKNNNDKNNNKKNQKYEIQILILGSSKKFIFFFLDYKIYQKFLFLIGSKIKNSLGNKSNMLGLSMRTKNFYKDTYMTIKQFESMAETGDLLLFRTLECISDCQRFFTRDQYDHIALIIKRYNMIELLESTSTDNCNLLEWRKFRFNLFNLVFKKIVLRKLNIEESNEKILDIRIEIQEKTRDFIDKIYKKKYDMSILKMAFDRKPKEYEVKGEWDKAKGFCCSALTAAYYIYIGVMKLEKSVHCIRPGDFEQDKNRLTVLPGFSFGPEKIIEFSE